METVLNPAADGTQQTVVSTETSSRQAIVDKYEQRYGQVVQPDPVVVTTASATPAEPSMADQIAAMEARLRAEFKATTPQPAVTAPVSQEEAANWLKLLADGKQAEAEIALSKIVAKNSNFEGLKGDAVREALEAFTVQQEVAAYTQLVRQDPANVEALRMEKYITAAVKSRMDEAQAAGLLKSPADYVKVYKASVDAEIAEARKLALTLRGEGRQEGVTRITQVMANPTLQPNKIDANRQQAAPVEEAPESIQDYFAKRNDAARVRHRL